MLKIEALLGQLGPEGLIRFLQQSERGSGDYTAERENWLENIDWDVLAQTISTRSSKYSFDDLLGRITEKNIHDEIVSGISVGAEVW